MTAALLAPQIYVVAFLLLHDWVTLPPLNDVAAVQAADTRARLLRVTRLSGLPFVVGLAGSVVYAGRRYPAWLVDLLWVSYGLLLAGAARIRRAEVGNLSDHFLEREGDVDVLCHVRLDQVRTGFCQPLQ